MFVRRIRLMPILNYVHYDKLAAMRLLQEKLGWVYYGGKHYESIYTRFYQAYVLPRKFDIDKRRAHNASLVLSGQLSRSEALDLLREPIYPEKLLREDRDYTIKKLGLTQEEFTGIMAAPRRTYLDYRTSDRLFEWAKRRLKPKRGYIG
jgi:hypothetical protein